MFVGHEAASRSTLATEQAKTVCRAAPRMQQPTLLQTSLRLLRNQTCCVLQARPAVPQYCIETDWHRAAWVSLSPSTSVHSPGSGDGWSRPMVSRPLRTAPLILVVALENANTVLPTKAAVPDRTPSTKYARPRPRAL